MNDKQVSSFIQAATYLNFHKAAQALYITQPALTYQIKSLEQELGFDLFVRAARGVSLTPAGESLYRNLIEINTHLENALEEARGFAAAKTNRLTLAWPPSIFDRTLMVNTSRELKKKLPNEDVMLAMSDKVNSLVMVEQGAADLTITLENDVEKMPELESIPLFNVQRCCLMSTGHPLAHLPRVSWNMLRTQTILLAPPNRYPESYTRLMNDLRAVHIPASSILYMDDLSDIDINVAAGRGIAIRPRPSVLFGKEQNGIVCVPFENAPTETVCIAYALDDDAPRKRLIADTIRQCLEEAAC